jgi:hypothetical protein
VVDADLLRGLKFSVALPVEVAVAELRARLGEPGVAAQVAGSGVVVQ